MVHVTRPRSFQGRFVIHGLGLAVIYLPTKCEVSISVHYEYMKRDTKCGRRDGLVSTKVTENSDIR